MGRGSAGSAEVCNSAACATLLHGLKTELVEDEDMGGGKEEPAEAGKKKKKKKRRKRKKKQGKDESEDPGDGPAGPPGGPGGASDGSRGSGLGPPLVAAT